MTQSLLFPALLLFAFWQGNPAFAQNTLTVDARSNIYAAGRGVAFHGLVPPALRFAAGAGKTVSFPTVSGAIACNGIAYEPLHGADGTVNRCGGTGTNITSWAGISGIIHDTREMFLVGVFLDEREPSDPAPDRLNFTTSENYSTLVPQLGQVFFIGDGRTTSGATQQVVVPANATRLYLGFADAVNFRGAPYAYNDNNGSLQVTINGLTPFIPGPVPTSTTLTVNGKSSIYWSGLDVNWPTEMPPGWKFTAAPGRTLTVRASGSVLCKPGISAPPQGTSACGAKTDIEPYGAVSGIKHPSRSMFLVGVFLNDLKPRGWPPSSLDFTNDNFSTLAPLIGQVFYIGTGEGKTFVVPHDATRVFLGYARSDTMTGNPGWYQQGDGSLTATISITAGAESGISPITVDAKSNIFASGRESAFDGYLPPLVRLTPGPGKVLRVPQVGGRLRCCGGGFTSGDGAPYHTNLNPYRGISGIEARFRGYFLAGVFLDDNLPDGAPPEKLIFREPFTFATLEPKIGQVFLIGDGLNPDGSPHQFFVPPTATRLYFGFATGRVFQGDPGYYWEANDAYTATFEISGGSPPPPTCTYSLSESSRAVTASATTGTLTLTTAAGCVWTAASSAPWLTITSATAGAGPATISYSVAANTGVSRSATITAGGATFALTQAAPAATCTYTLSESSRNFTAAASSGSITLTTTAGCSWTAVSSASWLTITSTASGSGPATINFSVSANTGAARSATLTVANQVLTVTQAAAGSTCTYTLNPANATIPATASTFAIQVSTTAGCTWTAASSVPWLTISSGASGNGPGSVTIQAAANTGSSRTATLSIAGQTVTVNQPAGSAPPGACEYDFDPASIAVWHEAFTGRIQVRTALNCAWTATSLAPWIRVTAGSSGTGPGAVDYAVDANPDANVRDGYIRIGTAEFLIKQAPRQSGPVISLGGVVNAATFTPQLAPGSLFTIFGLALSPNTRQASSLPLPDVFEGVSVEITDGRNTYRAPLFYISPNQVNGQLPYNLQSREVEVRLRNSRGLSDPATISLRPRAPQLFPWEGENPIVVHADYSLVSPTNPAKPGEVLIAFLVGMGAVNPPVAAGAAAPVSPLSGLTEPTTVNIGALPATVLYAGLAPYFVGLYQVNFQLPAGIASGRMTLDIAVGDAHAQSGLSLATEIPFLPPGQGVISSTGGSIQSGALTLNIPANDWSTPQTIELSEAVAGSEWRLRGIPSTTSQALELVLTLPAPPEGDRAAFLLSGTGPDDELYLPATVSGNTVRVRLPARSLPAPATSLRSSGSPAATATEEFILLFLTGEGENTSSSGDFKAYYSYINPETKRFDSAYGNQNKDKATIALRVLESAWSSLRTRFGFSEPGLEKYIFPNAPTGRLPLMVQIVDRKSIRKPLKEPFGSIRLSSWDGSRALLLERYLAMEPNSEERAKRPSEDAGFGPVIHTFFHLIQTYYDPPLSAANTNNWEWLHESTARLAERALLPYNNLIAGFVFLDLRMFLAFGQNEPDARLTEWDRQQYARGAALFLEHLWNRDGNPTLLHRIYTLRTLLGASIRPWAALDALALQPASQWQTWARSAATGKLAPGLASLWPGAPNAYSDTYDAVSAALEKSMIGSSNTWAFLSSNPLSVTPVLISTEVEPKAGTQWTFNLDVGFNSIIDVYSVSQTQSFGTTTYSISERLGTAPPILRLTAPSVKKFLVWIIQGKAYLPPDRISAQFTVTRSDLTPATAPWDGPGPDRFYFDSAVPMREGPKLWKNILQVWSNDYQNVTFLWNFPRFEITAPSTSYQDSTSALVSAGTIYYEPKPEPNASKPGTVAVVLSARKNITETSHYRLHIELANLPCVYSADAVPFYDYTCQVGAAELKANRSKYVTVFTYTLWNYNFNSQRWEQSSELTPSYEDLDLSIGAGIQVRFRGTIPPKAAAP